jgi:hypothetical protein
MDADYTPFGVHCNPVQWTPVQGVHQPMYFGRTWAKDQGITLARLAELIGRKATQTSDMLRGEKSFGEKIARDIEAKLGLRRYYLDGQDDEAPANYRDLIAAYDGLLPEQQEAVLEEMRKKAAENQRNYEVMRKRFGVTGVVRDHEVQNHIGPRPAQREPTVAKPPKKDRAKKAN